LKEIYLPAWQIFLKNWWEYIVVTIIMFLLVFIPLVGSIIQIFLILMMMNAILKSIRNGVINFSDFFQFKQIFNLKILVFALGLGLYYFLMQQVAALSIVLSLIGAVLSVIFFPIFFVLIDKSLNIKETILYSAKLTKDIRFEIIFVLLINLLIAIAGTLLLLIGILAAMPIGVIATAKVYLMLEEKLNLQIKL